MIPQKYVINISVYKPRPMIFLKEGQVPSQEHKINLSNDEYKEASVTH